MQEVKGNIWDYYNKGYWVVITTNGNVKTNGEAVMGRGVALEAKNRLPHLANSLGRLLRERGNYPFIFPVSRILTFPVKHNWWEGASIKLIELSTVRLLSLIEADQVVPPVSPFYMPRPGCGAGGLKWRDVKSILEEYLDDRFIVVQN